MLTLADVQNAFVALDAKTQEYALENVPSVPEAYLYYSTHWFFKNETEEVLRQRAIDQVHGAYVALKNDTYGLQD
jgi:hypothetical protein